MVFNKLNYKVEPILNKDAHPFILNIHYAKRLPPITYAYGLFCNNILVGVCTFSKPTGKSVASFISKNPSVVLELNRLVLINNVKNEGSYFISRCLKLLPENTIVVSFADTEQNHFGYVYQATNFKYYGLTQKKREYINKKGVHSRTACKNRNKDKAKLRWRPQKHRYIYITGKRKDYSLVKLKEQTYPKI